jgi:hypothetical protein
MFVLGPVQKTSESKRCIQQSKKEKSGKTGQYKNVKDKELVTKEVKKKQKTKQN